MTMQPSRTFKVEFNNLLPAMQIDREETMKAFNKFLEGGRYILGPEVEAFEKEFADLTQHPYCVGVGNGTEALTLALIAVGIEPGDTVLTVANSAPPVVAGIRNSGARVRFADVTPDGLMDLDQAENNLREIKAVVPVHLYGRVLPLGEFAKLCARKGIFVIEDACQAHGSFSWQYKIGQDAIATAYSFYPTKNLGAFGDGGAICVWSKELAAKLRALRHYGLSGTSLPSYGLNSRLDELQAALLRIRLKRLEEINGFKRSLAEIYWDQLRDLKHFRLLQPIDGDNCHLVPSFCEDRDPLQRYLLSKGIQTAIHYPVPAHRQPCESGHPDLPVTEDLCRKQLSLPAWYGLEPDKVDYVCQEIRRFYGE